MITRALLWMRGLLYPTRTSERQRERAERENFTAIVTAIYDINAQRLRQAEKDAETATERHAPRTS